MKTDRRNLLTLAGYTFLFSHFPSFAWSKINNNKILILIELQGANDGLNFFNLYQSKTFNKFFNFDKMKNFNINISQLLIPDLNFNIEKENYIELLTHEGYQLK